MTSNITSSSAETAPTPERRKKRQPIIAFGLAVLAVGGIGAAATSAAWTDNTWFSAPAAAATFNLDASLDGKAWSEGTSTTIDGVTTLAVEIPAATFANLLPAQTRTVNLWVRNDSSVDATLGNKVTFKNSTFAAAPTATVSDLAAKLTPAGTDQFTLTITTPADWNASNIGKSGTVVVELNATATAAS
ncbi:MAG TPA: hypothetical protein DIW46_00885 [Microbacterium sp.]|nr:hypothetical protein [Microbacterium sp.]